MNVFFCSRDKERRRILSYVISTKIAGEKEIYNIAEMMTEDHHQSNILLWLGRIRLINLNLPFGD